MAGTTVMVYVQAGQLQWRQTAKNKDADQALLAWCEELQVENIFIDAPLSLPGVYRDLEGCEDYFYRVADKTLKAMSPMFLGGLTARAMRLRANLAGLTEQVAEVYPGALARYLALNELSYKKEKEAIAKVEAKLAKLLPLAIAEKASNWHQIDAVLAWYSGYRYQQKQAQVYGIKEEGIIIV